MVFFKVLLFCLITYGYGRPSDIDEHDEIMREAKKEKYFQHDNVGETPHREPEPSTTENVLNRLKSIARLRMAETRSRPADETISREELETLKELLDRNLLKYQNYDERSAASRRRPNDPYIGQILHNLNGELQQSNGPGNGYDNRVVQQQSHRYLQTPVRRKIIRHTVFATPLNSGGGNPNRVMYGGDGDGSSKIEWSSPWADYFPILIKDPFQSVMNSFSEIIEYGPAADICRHGSDADRSDGGGGARESRAAVGPASLKRSRRNTAARTAINAAAADEEKGVLSNAVRPFRPHVAAAATTTAEPQKVYRWGSSPDKAVGEHNGDTGPQIKRLVVRRGGVAIAGPGGIATAGSGGTAIVGPGGSAYSTKDSASAATADAQVQAAARPFGISMAGYGPQTVQVPPGYVAAYPAAPQPYVGYARSVDGGRGGTAVLSTDGVAYTFPAASRGLTAAADDGTASAGRQISLPDGAKLIATGPIVYYNPEPRKRSRKGKKSPSAGASAKKAS